MTPHRAKIVITNPCSEDWNSMSPATDGRFCASCQKSVIDFSSKSDEEIKAFLKDKPGERLCGRFYTHQVERIRIEIDGKLLVSGIPFWQKFLVIILVCFGQDFFGIDFVFAQTQTDSVPVITEQVDSLIPEPLPKTDSLVLSAIDSVQKPIEFKAQDWETIYVVNAGMTMGVTTMVDERILFPERKTLLILSDPKEDTTTQIKGSHVSKPGPAVPNAPEKKPTLPENAIIADPNEKRKTRRS